MAGRTHLYRVEVEWTGNAGEGTKRYDAYRRDHVVKAPGKPDIACSSDPNFRGDPARWNPEELLVASIAACHKLWFLHLAATNGLVVESYVDHAEGVMEEDGSGGGRFVSATLHPEIVLSAGDPAKVDGLHVIAHSKCFIANSVNFPVTVEGKVRVAA